MRAALMMIDNTHNHHREIRKVMLAFEKGRVTDYVRALQSVTGTCNSETQTVMELQLQAIPTIRIYSPAAIWWL